MKVDLSKSKIYTILSFLLLSAVYSPAQTRSTNETKIVFILSEQTNEVSGIALFNDQNSEEILSSKYPKHVFYLGVFKGSYELNDNLIEPLSGATITVFTDKVLFSKDQFSIINNINIGRLKTKVVSKKKGELILKTL